MARSVVVVALALALGACYGPDPNQTEDNRSKPVLAAEFPDVAEPGSTETLTLTIENPGPGAFDSVFVTFARVGAAEGVSLPNPIVDAVPRGRPSPVVDVRPDPVRAVKNIRYRFPALAEGETLEVEFDLRVPARGGVAGNSVQVYDGSEPDRIRGVLLSTRVQ